jgi:KDO2-lipid IV(A) lauroyltransferase
MSRPADYIRPKEVDRRASLWQRVQWRLEVAAWYLLYWWPMQALGMERASKVGAWVMRRLGPRLSQHRTALRNLRLALPERTEAEREAIAREAWASAGATAAETPHLWRLNPYAQNSPVTVVGREHLDAIAASGKAVVFISGHFSNWEVITAVLCKGPVDSVITYRMLNNPHLDRLMSRLRGSMSNSPLVPKGLATRELMRALGKGRPVGLMNDQKFNEGLSIPFFGHEAMTAQGPSRLAVKYGVPVVPVATRRTGPGRFETTIYPPLHADRALSEEAQVHDLTLRVTQFIEARVRELPGQWFWMHRRWPKEAWIRAGVM